MKDFAKRKAQATKKNLRSRPSFKARHIQDKVIPNSQILILLFLAFLSAITSIYYFNSDIKIFEPREISNEIEFNFPIKLQENEILIEIDQSLKNIECTYFLQVETYGKKEFANETLNNIMNDGEAVIDEVNSVARPGKIFYRVLMGPYKNRSAVNNSRERITKKRILSFGKTVMHKEIEENIGNLLQELSSNKKIGHGEFNIRNIIGVSKKKSYEQIKIAYSCGIRSFGENYVQELEGKYKLNEIDGLNLEWHFIGPIQSNKIRSISKYASWVHSICRKKEVDILDSECLLQGKLMNILIQVNISNEDTKSGLLPEELMDFAEYIVEEKKNLLLKGIMVMPALSEDSSETIRVMNKSKELHQVMTKEYSFANTLSMGTTSDYMHAIDCGSSMIRIGELIFGKRQL